jgi:ParB family chromosome partitioning protein
MTANAKHSSATSEWHTPVEIIERARRVLGTIDLDPASCAAANERVGATRWMDSHGLEVQSWCNSRIGDHGIEAVPVSVWLNPPTPALPWWEKLMEQVHWGYIAHAIFLAFNAELLQTSQGRNRASVASFPFCAPSKRIRFLRPDGVPGPSPTHSSLIVYVPGTIDRRWSFCEAFSILGAILLPGGGK